MAMNPDLRIYLGKGQPPNVPTLDLPINTPLHNLAESYRGPNYTELITNEKLASQAFNLLRIGKITLDEFATWQMFNAVTVQPGVTFQNAISIDPNDNNDIGMRTFGKCFDGKVVPWDEARENLVPYIKKNNIPESELRLTLFEVPNTEDMFEKKPNSAASVIHLLAVINSTHTQLGLNLLHQPEHSRQNISKVMGIIPSMSLLQFGFKQIFKQNSVRLVPRLRESTEAEMLCDVEKDRWGMIVEPYGYNSNSNLHGLFGSRLEHTLHDGGHAALASKFSPLSRKKLYLLIALFQLHIIPKFNFLDSSPTFHNELKEYIVGFRDFNFALPNVQPVYAQRGLTINDLLRESLKAKSDNQACVFFSLFSCLACIYEKEKLRAILREDFEQFKSVASEASQGVFLFLNPLSDRELKDKLTFSLYIRNFLANRNVNANK